MKTVSEISIDVKQQQGKYSAEQIRKVKSFVASVYMLFTDYRGDFTKDEFFKDECRMWADDIIKFSNDSERLDMVKKLVAVSHMRELHGNYRTAKSTIAIACQAMDHLNHDYFLAYPRTGSTGELARIAEREKEITAADVESGKKTINDLKGLF